MAAGEAVATLHHHRGQSRAHDCIPARGQIAGETRMSPDRGAARVEQSDIDSIVIEVFEKIRHSVHTAIYWLARGARQQGNCCASIHQLLK